MCQAMMQIALIVDNQHSMQKLNYMCCSFSEVTAHRGLILSNHTTPCDFIPSDRDLLTFQSVYARTTVQYAINFLLK